MKVARVSAAAIVMDRDLGRCTICGHTGTDGHHRTLVGMGGSSDPDRDRPDRIVLLCRLHHGDVHRNPSAAGVLGFYRATGDVGEAVFSPVDRCWYWLLISGVRVAYPNWPAPAPTDLEWITPR